MISFRVSKKEKHLIGLIVDRFTSLCALEHQSVDRMSAEMDVTAVHANGCPLRLSALLAADNFNFLHDMVKIEQHLNRETGKLCNQFVPRFAARVDA